MKRDVWACWACLRWWPRSHPRLRRFTFGDAGKVACPRCGEYDMILLLRGALREGV